MSRAIALIGFICTLIWLASPTPGIPILAYHQVSEEDDIYSVTTTQFTEQMEYLASNGYTAISLEQLFSFYQGGATLPPKPIVITFDDGYEDNLLTALPIMEKFQMHSTVFVVTGLIGTPDYLSWQQIKEMQQRKTEIGSHTVSHIGLGSIDPKKQQYEVAHSKEILEEHLGPVKFFAYPYGDFTPITEQILKEAGYLGACSGIPGLSHRDADRYILKRINIPHPRYGLAEFRLRLLRANLYSKLGI